MAQCDSGDKDADAGGVTQTIFVGRAHAHSERYAKAAGVSAASSARGIPVILAGRFLGRPLAPALERYKMQSSEEDKPATSSEPAPQHRTV